ncbi:hypothetical protein V8C44DRAFT_321310 [Trichoderma aethiopicum]
MGRPEFRLLVAVRGGWKDKVEFGELEVIVKQRENVRLPLGDGMFCLAELLPLDIQFIRVHP